MHHIEVCMNPVLGVDRILLCSTISLLSSTGVYYTLPLLYLVLLDSTKHYYGSTWLYLTLTARYHGSSSFYFSLSLLYLAILDSTTLYHSSTCLCMTQVPPTMSLLGCILHSTITQLHWTALLPPMALLRST